MDELEFDRFADQYQSDHARNIAVTGEDPDFFAEYKVNDLAEIARRQGISAARILDFGSGIGNSLPWFRKYFPRSEINCADVSVRSINLARQRFPGKEAYLHIQGGTIPAADDSQDIAFSACVFHHISHSEHKAWLLELHRVCRSGALLMIFEHNPFNPLTVHAVNTCPFDINAKLILPNDFRRAVADAGWSDAKIQYRIFFPRALAFLRPIEKFMKGVMLGAQYCVIARKRE